MADTVEALGSQNRVFLNVQGIIEVDVVGIQSPETVKALSDHIKVFAKQRRAQGQTVVILDNLAHMGLKQPSAVPRAVAAEAKQLDFDRVAMLGTSNLVLKYGSNFIIQGMGMMEKMKYFSDRQQAIDWLLSA